MVFKVVWKIITVVSYEEITYFGHRYRSKGLRQKKKKILPISVTLALLNDCSERPESFVEHSKIRDDIVDTELQD